MVPFLLLNKTNGSKNTPSLYNITVSFISENISLVNVCFGHIISILSVTSSCGELKITKLIPLSNNTPALFLLLGLHIKSHK